MKFGYKIKILKYGRAETFTWDDIFFLIGSIQGLWKNVLMLGRQRHCDNKTFPILVKKKLGPSLGHYIFPNVRP